MPELNTMSASEVVTNPFNRLDEAISLYPPQEQYLIKTLASPPILSLDSSAPDILERIATSHLKHPNEITPTLSIHDAIILIDTPQYPNLIEKIKDNQSTAETIQLLADLCALEPTVPERIGKALNIETNDSSSLLNEIIKRIVNNQSDVQQFINDEGISLNIPSSYEKYAKVPFRQEDSLTRNLSQTDYHGNTALTLPYSRSEMLRNNILKQLIASDKSGEKITSENITSLIEQFSESARENIRGDEVESGTEQESNIKKEVAIFMEYFVGRLRKSTDYVKQLKADTTEEEYPTKLASSYAALSLEVNSNIGSHNLEYPLPSQDVIVQQVIPNLRRHLSKWESLDPGNIGLVNFEDLLTQQAARFFLS